MTTYLAVIEHEGGGCGAYCPDLPGLGVAAATREEVDRLIAEGVRLHIEGLREANEPVPRPSAVGATFVDVAVA